MEELLRHIVNALVENPDAVEINTIEDAEGLVLELRVAPDDMGRIIGKGGRRAQAIRTILRAKGNQSGERVRLDILD